jgi:formylglycine-generating enzyme required for sulfatase activity
MDFVTIGNAGNPPDPATGDAYGTVTDEYIIGKFEVTNDQYAQFLNHVDPLGANLLNLYSTSMNGATGGITFDPARPYAMKYEAVAGKNNHPVNYVTYYDAMRFVNWLHGGNTEDGAYALTSLEPSLGGLTRNASARFWIPDRNEWHKAAYYHGPDSDLQAVYGTDYSFYPMGGFEANNNAAPGDTNSANFGNTGTGLLSVGSFPLAASYYGTFDQGGNIHEWIDKDSFTRCFLGGSSQATEGSLRSTTNPNTHTTNDSSERGFRVAGLTPTQSQPVVPSLELKAAVEVEWSSQVGVIYQVQSSPDMVSWLDVDSPVDGIGGKMSVLRRIDSEHKFFRVIIID